MSIKMVTLIHLCVAGLSMVRWNSGAVALPEAKSEMTNGGNSVKTLGTGLKFRASPLLQPRSRLGAALFLLHRHKSKEGDKNNNASS